MLIICVLLIFLGVLLVIAGFKGQTPAQVIQGWTSQ